MAIRTRSVAWPPIWKPKLPGQIYGSPIVVGERIFVVSDPAELLGVNAADGAIVWKRSHPVTERLDAETAAKVTADYKLLAD